MMLRRTASRFEVIVELKGKPSIDGVFDEEKAALERAKYLLAQARFTAVRVARVSGAGKEETIFEKAYGGGGKVTTISHIEEANLCTDVLQVYSFESRMTLLRLLRAYWDEQQVIPAEQIHRYFPLRYLEREAILFNPAVSRLATLQAPKLGVGVFERQDELLRFFARIKDLAQNAGDLAPYDKALMTGGPVALREALEAACPAEAHDRAATHAVSAMLEAQREWPAKVRTLLRLHDPDAEETVRFVDEFLAETLDGREPIRALLGYAPDLASALLSLLATLRGELDDRLPHTDELLGVSDAVAHGGFLHTERAIVNRISGALEGTNPLTRTGGAAEAAAFKAIVEKLATADGFRGGRAIAVGLVRRGKMAMATAGRDLPFEETVSRLCARLDGPPARIGFLLDLAGTPYGRKRVSFLMAQVAALFAAVGSAAELAPPGVPPSEVRRRYEQRLKTAHVPKALADALIARIATMPEQPDPNKPALTILADTLDLSRRKEPRLHLSFGGTRHTLPDSGVELLIGRGHDCQIRLELASASRHHARISVMEDGFTLEDMSRNGTEVRAEKAPARTLARGDTVPLGERGEILIGNREVGETPVSITWEVAV